MIAETGAKTDQAVWESLQKGDRDALAHIYEAHISSLLNYGMTLTRDKDLVKDCIQELFITLWNQHSRLSPAHSIRFYLLVSLKRLMLKQLRKVQQIKELPPREVMDDSEHEFPAEHYMMDNERQQQQQKLLLREIDRLPKRQIEAVFLRFYEELSYEDIASIMNLNYQGARNIIYKSVKTLRKNMQNKWPLWLPIVYLTFF